MKRVAPVAYQIALPPTLSEVHDIFHVSQLRKYVHDPSHVVDFGQLELKADLSYVEEPVQIMERKDKLLRNRTIPLVRVLWRNHSVEESTWELESEMKVKFPSLFP
ncbi:hypothetical protein ACDT16_13705, partial [Staphylococcus aureus]